MAVIHNLDVPEAKQKYWPQWATVVVNRDGVIEDVIQHFEYPNMFLHRRHMDLYPRARYNSLRRRVSRIEPLGQRRKIRTALMRRIRYWGATALDEQAA